MHIIVPDLGQMDFGLRIAGTGPFASECIFEVSTGVSQCNARTQFNVYFNTINCCSPSCVHGGVCQSNGLCQCNAPYSGIGCINSIEFLLVLFAN